MSFGKPSKVKKLTKAFEIFGVVMLANGMASRNLVEAHIMVKRYWFLDLVLARGLHNQLSLC